MTPVGVFFCWQGGAERDFVNSTTLSRSVGSVPTPEHAAIVGGPAKSHGFVGRGGAAERVSFAACGEMNDTQLATTRQEAFSVRAATESKMEETHEREPI